MRSGWVMDKTEYRIYMGFVGGGPFHFTHICSQLRTKSKRNVQHHVSHCFCFSDVTHPIEPPERSAKKDSDSRDPDIDPVGSGQICCGVSLSLSLWTRFLINVKSMSINGITNLNSLNGHEIIIFLEYINNIFRDLSDGRPVRFAGCPSNRWRCHLKMFVVNELTCVTATNIKLFDCVVGGPIGPWHVAACGVCEFVGECAWLAMRLDTARHTLSNWNQFIVLVFENLFQFKRELSSDIQTALKTALMFDLNALRNKFIINLCQASYHGCGFIFVWKIPHK